MDIGLGSLMYASSPISFHNIPPNERPRPSCTATYTLQETTQWPIVDPSQVFLALLNLNSKGHIEQVEFGLEVVYSCKAGGRSRCPLSHSPHLYNNIDTIRILYFIFCITT